MTGDDYTTTGSNLYGYNPDYAITGATKYAWLTENLINNKNLSITATYANKEDWGTSYSDLCLIKTNNTIRYYEQNTATLTGLYSKYGTEWEAPIVTPEERMRQMIQARMAPVFHRRRRSLSIAMDVREERARQTLRRIIGEQAYRKFMRDGFITVVPKSGLTYRIFPGDGMTEVYDRGIMVDRLCVVLQGNFPSTDSLLMRYLLILNDEGEFSSYAVKHHVPQNTGSKLVFPAQEVQSLTEAWAKLKVA